MSERSMRDHRFVELFNLGKTYDTATGPQVIVEGFNLILERGEVVALIGHSGCGKSTVLSMVAGLCSMSTGGVVLDSKEIAGSGPDRGVVFQSPSLLPWLTTLENVTLGVRKVFADRSRAEQDALGREALSWVGLHGVESKHPGELSLGMQQRVGIARALALSPKMLLLDEPFGMLDSLTRMDLQEVLLGLVERDARTTLLVTHDVDEALFLADRIVMMTCGPAAKVGRILKVPFERPRDRAAVLEHPDYYELRADVIAFLDEQDRHRRAHAA